MSFEALWSSIFDGSREALEVVRGYTHVTPLSYSVSLSRISGCRVYLKYENLQKTGSFKVRGALYKVYTLRNKVNGVVAASAGNHAQGVAYAASAFGMRSVIVMPETASISKIEATQGYGAEVILYGRVYDEAYTKALEVARDRGYEFVHAFDDPHVIAGQATIAWELLEQLGEFDVILVPVGGGGLIAGVASVLRRVRPSVKIVGVEPEAAPKMKESLKAGKPVVVEPRPTVADGLVTRRPGDITFQLTSNLVDDVVTVGEEEISRAIYMLLERKKTLVEGAGAVGVATLLSGKLKLEGSKVVALLSGGNIDLTVLNKIILRGLAESGKLARIIGYIPDYPGQLRRALDVIARHRGNILDIVHDRSDPQTPAWHAKVTIVFETPNINVTRRIVEELEKEGFKFQLER
jgi:L-threonine ammonia-lyase (EC 4.3.1.19)